MYSCSNVCYQLGHLPLTVEHLKVSFFLVLWIQLPPQSRFKRNGTLLYRTLDCGSISGGSTCLTLALFVIFTLLSVNNSEDTVAHLALKTCSDGTKSLSERTADPAGNYSGPVATAASVQLGRIGRFGTFTAKFASYCFIALIDTARRYYLKNLLNGIR